MPIEANIDAPEEKPGGLPDTGWGRVGSEALGPLSVAWVPEGLTMLRFAPDLGDRGEWGRWTPELGDELPAPAAVPRTVEALLTAYLGGLDVDPALLPVRLRGTAFQERAWTALRRVPRGRVATYGALARAVGSPRATRAIGAAMSANPLPIVVPCHRIIAARHHLGGYSSGLRRKRWLLRVEGIAVVGDHVLPGQLPLFEAAEEPLSRA
ncbi:MAG: methylated-DNA--[protein]-cysteine S-methyltransferase [Sandaracinaceae bacterium]